MTEKIMLSFNEAAAYMGLSRSYLYKLTSSGAIPHYKPLGKKVYFDRQELTDFLRQHRQASTQEMVNQANQKGGAL